ncbi:hypothetical protein [Celerinatantimonas yamalensis]|uniref:Uncharacterized protein n=1 Tax=Celerinatantimonas yamalensis TaxID=559956 RepID=A0ABW9G3C5_9GAMM
MTLQANEQAMLQVAAGERRLLEPTKKTVILYCYQGQSMIRRDSQPRRQSLYAGDHCLIDKDEAATITGCEPTLLAVVPTSINDEEENQ